MKDLNGLPKNFVMLIEKQKSGEFTGLAGPEGSIPGAAVTGSVEENGDIEFSFLLEFPVPTIPDLLFNFTGSVACDVITGLCQAYEGKDLYRQDPFQAEKRQVQTVKANYGESITFNMQPQENYEVDDIQVDWKLVGAADSYTFENIDQDHHLHVKFRPVEAPPEISWQKSLGGSHNEVAFSIQQTNDGGYIVAGWTHSTDGDVTGNHGATDFWVVKLDNTGSIVWQKCFGGSHYDVAYAVQQTEDGGYIVAGKTQSVDGDVTINHGNNDAWIVKLNTEGELAWQRSLGGSADDVAYSIQQTTDSGYIVAGYTSSNDGDVSGNYGGQDFWVVKLDSNGLLQWQKCLGGSAFEQATSVKQTTDGGYIVAGWTFSNDGDVSDNNGSQDFWIVKLDSTGTIVWQKCLGGSNNDVAQDIQQTSDGGYVVAGYSYSIDGDVNDNRGSSDFWIVKLDGTGNIVWQKCLGGTQSEWAHSVLQATDGGYVAAGFTRSNDEDVTGNRGGKDFWIVKLDSSGELVWQKCLGGSGDETARSINQTSDGSYIVAGVTDSDDGDVTVNHGRMDFWVVKLE